MVSVLLGSLFWVDFECNKSYVLYYRRINLKFGVIVLTGPQLPVQQVYDLETILSSGEGMNGGGRGCVIRNARRAFSRDYSVGYSWRGF